jgi:hypothetical protein
VREASDWDIEDIPMSRFLWARVAVAKRRRDERRFIVKTITGR